MQLAIDSSTNIASLAISCKGDVKAELTWECGQNHTVELMPNMVWLLDQVGVIPQSISGIFIANGPGSFNGLRVGMGIAKGLAFSLGVPLFAVGTLEVEAYAFVMAKIPICPIHNAGRGEIASALYKSENGTLVRLVKEHISTVHDLCAGLEGATLFCGELSDELKEQLTDKMKERSLIPDRALLMRRAGCLSKLGWMRMLSGQADDPATLQPLYLRQPPITKPKKRIIGKGV